MKLSSYYEKLANRAVRCTLCRHRCIIREGESGICRVRVNKEGKLYSLVYGYPIALHIDPIEKKPLFHFLPGSNALSIATVGCNFRCKFCQNWDISQLPRDYNRVEGYKVSPEEVVGAALRSGSTIISYTYTEPTIFFEYALDISKLAVKKGIKNTFVTNGYVTEEALKDIAPYLHGANIDLKSMNPKFYASVVGARLNEVLDGIKTYKKFGIWLEITTLIIPGYNDSEDELREIARFIRDELGDGTPWHVSRFYPAYKFKHVPSTQISAVRRAREIGLEEGLKYVYTGNIPGNAGEDTHCPSCGEVLIRRWGFSVVEYNITNGKCRFCGEKIDGVWK